MRIESGKIISMPSKREAMPFDILLRDIPLYLSVIVATEKKMF